jgi:hypothetical protein
MSTYALENSSRFTTSATIFEDRLYTHAALGLHPHRIARGHCHHRHPGGFASASTLTRQAESARRGLPQQPAPNAHRQAPLRR